ncbi:hypothetical protein GYMLUDRAFT_950442 [Collybiopsis luxurians FD-317 M1]|nr:hypothetical protein GYMLUDRAFT_950442 [Collybiopsis luxurians FD-317 M1]
MKSVVMYVMYVCIYFGPPAWAVCLYGVIKICDSVPLRPHYNQSMPFPDTYVGSEVRKVGFSFFGGPRSGLFINNDNDNYNYTST